MITARMLNYVLIALLGILALCWIFWPTAKQQYHQPDHIDTVFVPKRIYITKIDTLKISLPQKVYVYLPDSVARAKAEKQDIITGVQEENGVLDVEKLTPKGIGIRQEYKLLPFQAILIDGQGSVSITDDRKARHRAWWGKVGRRALVVGCFVGGVFIGSRL